VLSAVLALAEEAGSAGFTMDELADRAGVSKRTIYRWWSGRSAVLVEALLASADRGVTRQHTGDLRTDLLTFTRTTYDTAGRQPVAGALRLIMAEGLAGGPAETTLREFVAARRAVLLAFLAEYDLAGRDPELIADTLFGVLWYRVLLGHAPLSGADAEAVVNEVLGGP
jgi:AcrR family transcriptional regulator